MLILPYFNHNPSIHPTAFIARGVVISGDVVVGEQSNIWYNTVIRGDISPTRIGKRVSVQDNCTLHQSPNIPLVLEDDVIIGHNAILHSCTIGKGALIGMGAIILDGAEIGEYAMVGAGTVVPPRKNIPPHSLVVGNPARVMRQLNEDDYKEFDRIVNSYVQKGEYYKSLEEALKTK